jgi:hypothetical protein
MDNQNQKANPTPPQATSQLPLSPSPINTPNQQTTPKAALTESQAESILALNNLQAPKRTTTVLPTKLLIIIGVLITMAILASYLVSSIKPGSSSHTSGSSLGLPAQSDTNTTNGASQQINQDVKTCSNPINAATVC